MSLTASLDIAQSGLEAASAQLALVSQNVANAATPGYIVQSLPQDAVYAANDPAGVQTGGATIDVNAAAQAALFSQNGQVAGLSVTAGALSTIDAVQGTVAGGNDLGSLLANVQAQFTTLAQNPAAQSQQAAVVSAAGQLASHINALGTAYQTARQQAQNTLVTQISQANADLAQIGSLNTAIVAATQQGQSTATLETQRDAALADLSGLMTVQTFQQSDGAIAVATASGTVLPLTGSALSFAPAELGPDASIALGSAPAITLNGQDVTDTLGGAIGANVTLRDVTLPTYQAELDQFAQTLSSRFANQGLALFTDASGNVPAGGGVPAQSGYVGYAQQIEVNPAIVANPALVRDGTTAIAGSPTGASSFTPNTDPTNTGFETLIQRVLAYALGADAQAGVPQAPVPSTGLGPAGNLAAPYPGVVTLSDTAAALVGAQSADVANATTQLANEQAVQTTLSTQFSASTAVNTDQQMALMVQLQNAYGANARILTTVQSMYQDLLTAVGGP